MNQFEVPVAGGSPTVLHARTDSNVNLFKVPVVGSSLTVACTCGISVNLFKVPVVSTSLDALHAQV